MLTADAGALARFQREARIAAGLTHPNIVAVVTIDWLCTGDVDADGKVDLAVAVSGVGPRLSRSATGPVGRIRLRRFGKLLPGSGRSQ